MLVRALHKPLYGWWKVTRSKKQLTMSNALATSKVAAVLAGLAMVFGVTFAFATPAKADVISDLQAQIQALLAQIAALSGGSTTTGGSCTPGHTFTRNHKQGDQGGEVMWIQQFLNANGITVAASGAGSPGNETSYFVQLPRLQSSSSRTCTHLRFSLRWVFQQVRVTGAHHLAQRRT